MRYARRIDRNQQEIVKHLRSIPGVSVELRHDDILVGYKGVTYWYEVKATEVVSARTARVQASKITKSEKLRALNWTGHYSTVWNVDQILEELGI